MNPPDIARNLNALTSMQDVEQLKQLEALVNLLDRTVITPELYRALFDLYERFPEDDGYGIFSSILHFLETCSRYEQFLIESMRRKPTYTAIRMVDRLVLGGLTQLGEVNLLSLVQAAATSSLASESARVYAQECLQDWSASDADA
jgi:hypothetical protein